MYQVTLYDKHEAVVYIEQFSHHGDAINFMVDTALGNLSIASVMGKNPKFKVTHWELSQRTKRQGLVPYRV